ncbi:MAG: hypothetical protein FRX49_13081 [Trebouxia sp. A1-2]|nr:MAG: hypothetical protein FRX49_13081 [Trebouxia sp. A1-2]
MYTSLDIGYGTSTSFTTVAAHEGEIPDHSSSLLQLRQPFKGQAQHNQGLAMQASGETTSLAPLSTIRLQQGKSVEQRCTALPGLLLHVELTHLHEQGSGRRFGFYSQSWLITASTQDISTECMTVHNRGRPNHEDRKTCNDPQHDLQRLRGRTDLASLSMMSMPDRKAVTASVSLPSWPDSSAYNCTA